MSLLGRTVDLAPPKCPMKIGDPNTGGYKSWCQLDIDHEGEHSFWPDPQIDSLEERIIRAALRWSEETDKEKIDYSFTDENYESWELDLQRAVKALRDVLQRQV